MDNARFDRIESKIDKLTDAVTLIARVEEKILASNDRLDRAEVRLDKNERDIDTVSQLARSNNGAVKFADKAFWIVFGACFSLVVYFMKGS